MSTPTQITVVGSLNIDRIFSVKNLPRPGETTSASGMIESFGGKGANQAIAAARAGAHVNLIACIGADSDGQKYIEYLTTEGIDTSGIATTKTTTPTGSAFIAVDESGENSIIVHPAANAKLEPEFSAHQKSLIANADVLLLQLECPLDTVYEATQIAKENNVKVVLNPSPINEEFDINRVHVDYLIVNETEAFTLSGKNTLHEKETLGWVAEKGLTALVVTRGAQSTLLFEASQGMSEFQPASIQPIDTVGAGDSFTGAFATTIAEKQSLANAITFGNASGALATQKPGAQNAIPHRESILEFLNA